MIKSVLFFLLLIISTSSFSADYSVFVIHSYEQGTWTKEGTEGIKKAFSEANVQAIIHEEIYDYTKIISSDDKSKKINHILSRVKILNPSLIILFDDEATEVMLPSLNKLSLPIIITGINKDKNDFDKIVSTSNGVKNFTVIFERYPFEQSLKMLKQIKPSVTHIDILTSENETSRIVSNQFKEKFKSYRGSFSGIKLGKINISSSWETWKKIIKSNNFSNRAFWILVPWNVNDQAGKEVDLRVIGDFYRNNSRIPEIGIVNINDKLGFVASFSVGAEDLGYQSGQIGIKVLKDKIVPGLIPYTNNNLVRFVINKRRADQLNIPIPKEFLDFAKIEKKIPMDNFR